MKRKLGRPPRAGAPTYPVTFRATDVERANWDSAARREGIDLSAWIRDACDWYECGTGLAEQARRINELKSWLREACDIYNSEAIDFPNSRITELISAVNR